MVREAHGHQRNGWNCDPTNFHARTTLCGQIAWQREVTLPGGERSRGNELLHLSKSWRTMGASNPFRTAMSGCLHPSLVLAFFSAYQVQSDAMSKTSTRVSKSGIDCSAPIVLQDLDRCNNSLPLLRSPPGSVTSRFHAICPQRVVRA